MGLPYQDSWLHFLCKHITVEEDKDGVKRIVNKNHKVPINLSQGDNSWARAAYCLISKPPAQGRSFSEVTLLVFSVGAAEGLRENFSALAQHTSWQAIHEDSFYLLNLVFEGLYARIDSTAWDLAGVSSQEEAVRKQKQKHCDELTPSREFSVRRSMQEVLQRD
ncbi:hypothetical protein ACMFMG_006711 [Clarireedia jacksonii]